MLGLLAAGFATSAAGSAVIAAAHRWGRRRDPLADANAFIAACITVMAALGLVNLLAARPDVVWPVATASHLVLGIVVASVFCLTRIVADRSWRVSRRVMLLLAVQPAAELVLAVTNPRHHLLYTGLRPGAWDVLVPAPGPAFLVSAVYLYALLTAGVVRVVRARRRAPRGRRELYDWTLAGFVPPGLAGASAALPVPVPDLTALGLGVTALITYRMLVRSLSQHIQVAHGQVFDSMTDAVAVLDRDGRILDLNAAARDLLARTVPGLPERLEGRVITEIRGFDLALTEGTDTEQTLTDTRGRRIDLHVRASVLRDRRGDAVGWALVGRDVTELNRRRREAEESAARLREQLRVNEALRADLAEQAVRDALTGLHNRRHLVDTLEREARRAAGEGAPLSLAIIDVDHFKRINDTYGHGGGDAVLVRLAGLLADSVRQGDVVARYGGEEFVLLLPGVTEESAWRLVERLRERTGRTAIEVEGRALTVTFSAGVAGLAAGGSTEDLLRAADAALYEAKRRGRDRVERAGSAPSEGPVETSAAPSDDRRSGPARLAAGEAA
ncbi:signaling protein [Planomonospora sphaerica]|uniref:Signaling protein n=1 Tax=Planomonospora sphaerica TaxID=161355 RepID=A0A171DME6_9ACTN|nr:diguanylate cyclase [Planomonospora sphaerica]GAT70132.1 signaling protein [Planomonospora sphaerica]